MEKSIEKDGTTENLPKVKVIDVAACVLRSVMTVDSDRFLMILEGRRKDIGGQSKRTGQRSEKKETTRSTGLAI